MQDTPKGMRIHIGIFGRRNVGKSSLLNALTQQDVAIVSDIPGTTTDVVQKPIELKPLGPVLFLDTAGLDDVGSLGEKRMSKTKAAIDRVDLSFLVTDHHWDTHESQLAQEFKTRNIPFVTVFNKSDVRTPSAHALEECRKFCENTVQISAEKKLGLNQLRQAIVQITPPALLNAPDILSDLIGPGDIVILVVPIDLEAPKGRLILPQVQAIREVLDCDAKAIIVKERELTDMLNELKRPSRLVVTDSQAILKVSADVPDTIPLTGFSVLFARWKGDLETFVRGTRALDTLKPGNRVLILESCSHHPIGEDIGRVKIPRWLTQYIGGELKFEYCIGNDFPRELQHYDFIIHCGACMTNRKEVLTRILRAQEAQVPISNYGLVIAKSLGVLPRILSPFPGLAELAIDIK